MDLVALIEHKKSPNELLLIPSLINNCLGLKDIYHSQYGNNINIKTPNWNGPFEMTCENLEKIWLIEENNKCQPSCFKLLL